MLKYSLYFQFAIEKYVLYFSGSAEMFKKSIKLSEPRLRTDPFAANQIQKFL